MFIADLHIHSKYSRATSKDCVPEHLDLWARRKGLQLIGTGDFTHPAWRAELREKLRPAEEGLYTLGEEFRLPGSVSGEPTRFLVTGEISSIYKRGGRVRKVHSLILLPSLEAAEALALRLEAIGNLHSDGRPILGLDSRDLLEITLECCPRAVFIPAHIWTPHFSLFGAYSGFDEIGECFGDLTGHIHALETGLSSNPPMNWRLSALDDYLLVSNSDAHSPANLAREANLFDTELSYTHIARALDGSDPAGFSGTLEFYPEEGKYHFDGHRGCGVCQSPTATIAAAGACPVCGRKVTVGVLHRVEALADRPEGYRPPGAKPFESIIPLPEVLAASTGFSATSKKGRDLCDRLLRELGPELHILRRTSPDDVAAIAGPAAAEGLRRLRAGRVEVSPGYDGAYGKVRILSPHEIEALSGQLRLFPGMEPAPQARPKERAKAAKGAVAAKPAPPAPAATRAHSLNDRQRAAVVSDAAVTAVVAGPGTGKTGTLVARIAHLVGERGVKPAHITAVTFTNKAAGELRARLERQLGVRKARAMTIGTFHAICLQAMGEGSPAIVDEAAARALLEEVCRELDLKCSARDTLRRISLEKCGADGGDLPPGVLAAYNARLAEYGVLDYDDILLRALERDTPPTPHLLVDEFQDVSPVQYRLIRKWSGGGESLFVIGDHDQAIYGFRGSDHRCFSWLRADYPALREITLLRNYRSTPQVLAAAAPVLAKAAPPLLEADRPDGARVRLVTAESAFTEALFVVKELGRMVGGIDMLESDAAAADRHIRGFSDFAVLYRTNRQAALLEDCLIQEGIPYVVSGRESLLTHPETARLLALFRLLLGPADLAALWACLRTLTDCGPERIRAILSRYRRGEPGTGVLLSILAEEAPAESAPLTVLLGEFDGTAAKLKPRALIERWAALLPPADPVWLEKLLHLAHFHDTMADLLRAVALGGEQDIRRFGGKRYTGDAVLLSTLHGAKGLEFPVVFLCGLTDGLIPHHGPGRSAQPDEAALQEERRLLYVGMTRAKDELILLNHGAPSPFLAHIPPALLEPADARPGRQREYRQYSLFD